MTASFLKFRKIIKLSYVILMWYDSEAQPEKLDFSSEISNQDGFKCQCSALAVNMCSDMLSLGAHM